MTFDPTTHRFGMAYKTTDGIILNLFVLSEMGGYGEIYIKGQKARICRTENLTRAPEHDLIPRADVMKLVDAVRTVVEDGVQETSGKYLSHKNNKCQHGNFGYEGCGNCTDEYLEKALTDFNAKHGDTP